MAVSACETAVMSVNVVLTVPLLMRSLCVLSGGCLKELSLCGNDEVEIRELSLRRR